MKTCSASSVIRDTPMLKFLLTQIRIVKSHKNKETNKKHCWCIHVKRKGNTSSKPLGGITDITILEIGVVVIQISKNRSTIWPSYITLSLYPRNSVFYYRYTYSSMFIFQTIEIFKLSTKMKKISISINKWIIKLLYISKMDYYFAI